MADGLYDDTTRGLTMMITRNYKVTALLGYLERSTTINNLVSVVPGMLPDLSLRYRHVWAGIIFGSN